MREFGSVETNRVGTLTGTDDNDMHILGMHHVYKERVLLVFDAENDARLESALTYPTRA